MKKMMRQLSWVFAGLMVPVLALAAPLMPVSEVASRSSDAADVHPGVIVDPEGVAIYLMNPAGGIDAVSSASGELLWSTRSAARPLSLLGNLLIAQGPPTGRAGVLDLVLLDTGNGELRRTLAMALPADVRGAVDQGMSTSFEARGIVAQGEPYVVWSHTRRYAKGVAPEPGEELEQKDLGASRLDLATGRAVAVDPAVVQREVVIPATVRQTARQWQDAGELSAAPAPAGGVLAATRVVGGRIVLKRWNPAGVPLADVELFSESYLLAIRSADGRHLLVVERVAPGEWEEYGWSVFSLETGQRLGQVRNHQSHAWYVVRDSSLIYVAYPYGRAIGDEWVVEKQKLRAVEVDGGALIWERPLRDTEYRGPFPP